MYDVLATVSRWAPARARFVAVLTAPHVFAVMSLVQNNLPEAERVVKQALGILERCPDFPGAQLAMAASLSNLSIIQMRQVRRVDRWRRLWEPPVPRFLREGFGIWLAVVKLRPHHPPLEQGVLLPPSVVICRGMRGDAAVVQTLCCSRASS